MVKHSLRKMAAIFTRERFGTPQFAALFLLVLFLAQALLLVAVHPMPQSEIARVQKGLAEWRTGHVEIEDPYRSPLYYAVPAIPLLATHRIDDAAALNAWRVPARAVWLLFGVLLGASIWYVARRLYGNPGGYIALLLYCFSPIMLAEAASFFVQPELGATWGAFGALFTAIAVSHTLYAPRRVLWNWRRILLLGVSLALAIGSQFSLWVVLPLALAFLLYLAPGRRGAALAIFSASCCVAFVILLAAYAFSWSTFASGMRHAAFLDFTPQTLKMGSAYTQFLTRLMRTSPALLVLFPLTLVTFVAWPRARYFGNAAPLIVSLIFIFLGLITPHQPGMGFELVAMPILFVFVAGVVADLLETRQGFIVLALVGGLLFAYAVWSVTSLIRFAA